MDLHFWASKAQTQNSILHVCLTFYVLRLENAKCLKSKKVSKQPPLTQSKSPHLGCVKVTPTTLGGVFGGRNICFSLLTIFNRNFRLFAVSGKKSQISASKTLDGGAMVKKHTKKHSFLQSVQRFNFFSFQINFPPIVYAENIAHLSGYAMEKNNFCSGSRFSEKWGKLKTFHSVSKSPPQSKQPPLTVIIIISASRVFHQGHQNLCSTLGPPTLGVGSTSYFRQGG